MWMRHVTRVHESCHTYELDMPHERRTHVTRMRFVTRRRYSDSLYMRERRERGRVGDSVRKFSARLHLLSYEMT